MEQIPKIAQQRLQIAKDTENHPDANLLSAFAEKALSDAENAGLLRHLSQCADCRDIAILAQPEMESILDARVPVASIQRWHGFRWAVWAACVIVVGGAIAFYQREQPVSTQMATAIPPVTTAQIAKPSPAIQKDVLPAVASSAPAETAQTEEQSSSTPRLDEKKIVAADVAPASSPASQDSMAANTPSSGAMASRMAFAPDAKAENRAANAMVFSKTVGPRWTLTPDGVLQRSLDAGKTWQPITVANGTVFRAVTAFGSDIWVGGAAGALYHSADAGSHWEQVTPSSNGVALNADITALEFRDAQHGTISTSTGTWATADAGQSWQKQ